LNFDAQRSWRRVFTNSKNKLAYMYILTPEGIKSKMEMTCHFLHRKMDEYDALKVEIEELREALGIEYRE